MAYEYVKTSPSQKSTFDLCERRWYFGSIMKLPQPQAATAAEGEAMHKQNENWSLYGIEPVHPSCIAVKTYIAPPKTESIVIEAKTTNPPLTVAGLLINGRLDYMDYRNPEVPLILDYKSKGKSLKGLSKRALAEDPAMNLYAAWALKCFPEATGVRLAHLYMSRDVEAPGVKWVEPEAPVPRHAIERLVASFEPGFERMKVVSQATDPMEVAHNDKACHEYGTVCPFFDKCFPTTKSRFQKIFREKEKDEMGLIDKLKGNTGAASLPPLPGAATATAEPMPAETSATSSAAARALEALQGTPTATETPKPAVKRGSLLSRLNGGGK